MYAALLGSILCSNMVCMQHCSCPDFVYHAVQLSILNALCRRCLQKYANHDLVKYLESIGAEFGACQNAYTSADDTVYEFMVPTDDANLEILDRSFDVFAEFATKIRCAESCSCIQQQCTSTIVSRTHWSQSNPC